MKRKNLLKYAVIALSASFFVACATAQCECETSKYKKKKYSAIDDKNNSSHLFL
jgi:hypothetical protein